MFNKIAKGLGLIGGGLYLYNALTDSNPFSDLYSASGLFERARRNEWLSASALQLQGVDMIARVSNPALSDLLKARSKRETQELKEDQEEGTAIHKIIQKQLASQGLGTPEYYVEDTANKVFGSIDFMLNGGIPMEIKTVDPGKLGQLTKPKRSHVSQLNFDMIASNSQVGYLMYAERNDPNKRKVFALSPDFSLYQSDVGRGRNYQQIYGNLPTASPYLSGFRPLNSLSHINNDVPVIMNRSKFTGQKQRLANLPAFQSSYSGARHPNERGRMNGYS